MKETDAPREAFTGLRIPPPDEIQPSTRTMPSSARTVSRNFRKQDAGRMWIRSRTAAKIMVTVDLKVYGEEGRRLLCGLQMAVQLRLAEKLG